MTKEQEWLAYVAKIRHEHDEQIESLRSELEASRKENEQLREALKSLLPLAIFWDCQNKEKGDRETINKAKSLLAPKP